MFEVEMFRDVAYFGDRLKVAKFEDGKTTVLTDLVWKELKEGEYYEGVLLLDVEYDGLLEKIKGLENNEKEYYKGKYQEALKTIEILKTILYNRFKIKE